MAGERRAEQQARKSLRKGSVEAGEFELVLRLACERLAGKGFWALNSVKLCDSLKDQLGVGCKARVCFDGTMVVRCASAEQLELAGRMVKLCTGR